MSYCRFSTDNFMCDIYAYEDVAGGITIYVASNRWPDGVPAPLPDFTGPDALDAAIEWSKGMVPIGKGYDGLSYHGLSKENAVDLLTILKREGYRFPDYVIEDITAEEEEQSNG